MSDEPATLSPSEIHANVDGTSIQPSPARKNSLEDYLKHRPTRSDLVEKNILPESTAAPALLAHQQELKKHILADQLNDKIAHRPSPEKLVKEGVLHEDPRTPEEKQAADQKYLEAMEDEYAKREGGA